MTMKQIPQRIRITEIILVVSIPMTRGTHLIPSWTIHEAEEAFVLKRDHEYIHPRKVEFDRVRALLKAASCYDANLIGMEYITGELRVSLGFTRVQDLNDFKSNMNEMVEGAMMH